MGAAKIGFVALVLWVVAGALISCGTTMVSGQGQCDYQGLEACWDYVKKQGEMIPPSPQCCDAIKNVDMPCICQHLPISVCPLISMKKVIYVTQYCKKPLGGSKCGPCTEKL